MKIIVERKKIRNLYMRFDDEEVLHITAPTHTSEAFIHHFIDDHRNWIYHTQKRIHRNFAIDAENLHAEHLYWFGKPTAIVVRKGEINHAVYENNTIRFTLNKLTDEIFRQTFHRIADKRLAALIYEERKQWDQDICRQYGLPLPSISLRYMVSRWGVCRPEKAHITISTRLIHYPQECLSYILLHEYVHFLVRNHSAAFYEEVEKRMKNYRQVQNFLKGEF